MECSQCPFCYKLLCEPQTRQASGETPLGEHVIAVHHKVRVTKGRNYSWTCEGESRWRVAETPEGRKR